MTQDGNEQAITPEALWQRLEAGEPVELLDVRNREEIDAWQIDGEHVSTTDVPYMRFLSARVSGEVASLVDPEQSYVVVCPRGEESAEVTADLRKAGIDAQNLAGGMEGWAQVYLSTTIAEDPTVLQYHRPASGCLAYAVVSGGDALVVDPLRAFVDRYAADVATLDAEITHVLDTHVHADHVSGVRALAAVTNATPIVPAGATDRGLAFEADTIADGATIAIGDTDVEVLATPGHTTDAVSLVVDGTLLSGDSLFLDGVPRPDLQFGTAAAEELAGELYDTLTDRLAGLPDDTVVAPGHVPPGRRPDSDGSYTARLGELRDRLSAFSEERSAFVDRIIDSIGEPPANHERIVAANLGQESLTDEDAFEVELGPNNCAVAVD